MELNFETFWAEYPLKHKRKNALAAFQKIQGKVTMDELLSALKSYKAYLAKTPWLSPAHAATWLNGERWTDVYETAAPTNDFSWKALRGTHVSKYQ